jgi:hypothetical protein
MSNKIKDRLIIYAKFNYLVLGEQEAKQSYEGTSLYDLCAKALRKIGINQNSMETKKFVSKNVGTMQTYLLRQGQMVKKPATAKTPKKPKKQRIIKFNDDFLNSYEWRKLRLQALLLHGRQCQCCGAKPPNIVLNVDHIKPRKTHPELALTLDNLQVLCHECNHGKGNWLTHDFR